MTAIPNEITTGADTAVSLPDLAVRFADVYPKVLAQGYDKETIAENSRPNLGPAYVAVVLNIDHLAADLKAKWGE
jgi:hypothetical protein